MKKGNEVFQSIGNTLAGIGLFLTGIRLITNSFKGITNRRLRRFFLKWTQKGLVNAAWGTLIGALTQSSSSATFILAGMLSGGLITFINAAITLTWVEIGTTLLVFLASIKMKLIIIYLLAVAGFFFSMDKKGKNSTLVHALLGIGLLLFGFDLLKSGAMQLTDTLWIRQLIQRAQSSFLPLFFLGGALRLTSQSSSAVTILVMPLTLAGIFNLEQSLLVVFGTALGSGISTALLSMDISGAPRKLSIYKMISDLSASAALMGLLIIEKFSGLPLIKALIQRAATLPELQISIAFLLLKLAPIVLLLPNLAWIEKIIDRIAPRIEHESLSQPEYLSETALENPDTAFFLIEKEQNRIIDRLPEYPGELRDEARLANPDIITAETYHLADLKLLEEIRHYISQLHYQSLSYQASEQLLIIQNRNLFLSSLEATVNQIVQTSLNESVSPSLLQLRGNLIESLHMLLDSMREICRNRDAEELDMLSRLTDNRNGIMENIRKKYISLETEMEAEHRMFLLIMTDLFQRAVWLIHENIYLINIEINS